MQLGAPYTCALLYLGINFKAPFYQWQKGTRFEFLNFQILNKKRYWFVIKTHFGLRKISLSCYCVRMGKHHHILCRTNQQVYPVDMAGCCIDTLITTINTLRPRQNGRHFPDNIFKWIFLNENVWIPIKMSLKFVPHGLIDNIPALV